MVMVNEKCKVKSENLILGLFLAIPISVIFHFKISTLHF